MTKSARSSPIFTRAYDFLRWIVPKTLNFPKSQRGVLAKKLQSLSFELYDSLIDASMSQHPEPHLLNADRTLRKLRSYIRLSRDLSLLAPDNYQFASESLVEIGRLLGGWLKKIRQQSNHANA